MRDSVARAEAAGSANADTLAALAGQVAELRAAQLDWQQNVLSGRLAALRADSERIAANDRLKARAFSNVHCLSSWHQCHHDCCHMNEMRP